MCWSKTASILAFTIGSLVNFLGVKYVHGRVPQRDFYRYVAIAIIWEYVLMMQLAEFFIWLQPNGGIVNSWGTVMAKTFNITQPLVLFIGLVFGCRMVGDISGPRVKLATILMFMYMCWVVFCAIKTRFGNDLNIIPRDGDCIWSSVCTSLSGHLSRRKSPTEDPSIAYPWWDAVRCYGGPVPYIIAVFSMVLLLLPVCFGLYTAVFIGLSMWYTSYMSKRRFGKAKRFFGSSWCLYVLAILLLNPFVYVLCTGPVIDTDAVDTYEDTDD